MKKFFITLMCIIMVVCFMPTVAMAEGGPENTSYGTVSKITDIATVTGDNTANPVVTCSNSVLEWAQADPTIGRMWNGWWVGIKITAPSSLKLQSDFQNEEGEDQVVYQSKSGGAWSANKSFWNNQDSNKNVDSTERFLTMWGMVNEEYLNNAKSSGNNLEYKWRFDWNKDGQFEQLVTLEIDPTNFVLTKDSSQVYPVSSLANVTSVTGGTVTGSTTNIVNVTVTETTLSCSPINTDIGRNEVAWWSGINVYAPKGMASNQLQNVNYQRNDGEGWSTDKSFWANKDSKDNDAEHYIGMWLPITPDSLKEAIANETDMTRQYRFDWNQDRDRVFEQYINFTVKPSDKIVLNHTGSAPEWTKDTTTHSGTWDCCGWRETTDHTYGNWTVVKDASYTEKGSKKHSCSVCGYEEIVEIPMLTLPYIPTTPTTPTDKPSEPNQSGTTTTTDISNTTTTSNGTTTATVDKTTADKIVDKAVENKSTEVVIDATANTTTAANSTTVAQVTIPTETLGAIAEKTEADVTIKTDVAEVKMDNTAAAAVSEQAEGDTVQIIAEKVAEDAEKVEFELKVVCSEGKVISDFNGGNIAVTVALPKAMAEKKVVCVYIDDNGHMSKVEGQKNADGTYTFVTGHFSTYAILSEEEADAAIAAQNEAIKNIKIKVSTKLEATKAGKKGIKVTWKTADGKKLDGVEFFRSVKKNSGYGTKAFFTSKKAGNTGNYVNTKSLKKGTRYYYRARGYVLVDGQKVYTDWSNKGIRTFK